MKKAERILKVLDEVRYDPEETITFISSAIDDFEKSYQLKINILAQTPERSYEDRDVFLEIEVGPQNEPLPGDKISGKGTQASTWINGESAIELGTLLIEAGNKSLGFNRLHAYEVIELLAAKSEISKGKFSKVSIIRKGTERPSNYGPGFYYFDFIYHPAKGVAKYEGRHIKDVVVYWSPTKKDYNKQLKVYTSDLPVEFIGWDWKTDIFEPFQVFAKKMNQGQK